MNISEYFTTTISPLLLGAFSVIGALIFLLLSHVPMFRPARDRAGDQPGALRHQQGGAPHLQGPGQPRAHRECHQHQYLISTIYREIFNVISNTFAIFKTFESRTNIKLSRFLSDDVLLFFLFLSSSFSDMRYIWRRNAHTIIKLPCISNTGPLLQVSWYKDSNLLRESDTVRFRTEQSRHTLILR